MRLSKENARKIGVAINSMVVWDRLMREELRKPTGEWDAEGYANMKRFYNDAIDTLHSYGIVTVRRAGDVS